MSTATIAAATPQSTPGLVSRCTSSVSEGIRKVIQLVKYILAGIYNILIWPINRMGALCGRATPVITTINIPWPFGSSSTGTSGTTGSQAGQLATPTPVTPEMRELEALLAPIRALNLAKQVSFALGVVHHWSAGLQAIPPRDEAKSKRFLSSHFCLAMIVRQSADPTPSFIDAKIWPRLMALRAIFAALPAKEQIAILKANDLDHIGQIKLEGGANLSAAAQQFLKTLNRLAVKNTDAAVQFWDNIQNMAFKELLKDLAAKLDSLPNQHQRQIGRARVEERRVLLAGQTILLMFADPSSLKMPLIGLTARWERFIQTHDEFQELPQHEQDAILNAFDLRKPIRTEAGAELSVQGLQVVDQMKDHVRFFAWSTSADFDKFYQQATKS